MNIEGPPSILYTGRVGPGVQLEHLGCRGCGMGLALAPPCLHTNVGFRFSGASANPAYMLVCF